MRVTLFLDLGTAPAVRSARHFRRCRSTCFTRSRVESSRVGQGHLQSGRRAVRVLYSCHNSHRIARGHDVMAPSSSARGTGAEPKHGPPSSSSTAGPSTSSAAKADAQPPPPPPPSTMAGNDEQVHIHRPTSPGVATGAPWTHPPNMQQFPPPFVSGPAARNASDSPAPAASSASANAHKGKSTKPPQTIADAVAASVGNKKERKRKVSRRGTGRRTHIAHVGTHTPTARTLLLRRMPQAQTQMRPYFPMRTLHRKGHRRHMQAI